MRVRPFVAVGLVLALAAAACSGPDAEETDDPRSSTPSALPTAPRSQATPTPTTIVRSSTAEPNDTLPNDTLPNDTLPNDRVPTDLERRVGAEVLADRDFDALEGRRVGAIVNQTSLVDGRRLIDLLANHDDIELVRLFAPEHGIDGSLAAGVSLADSVDQATGVEVVSLYGATRRPTPQMFDDLDVVIFDLQDVGSRSYTYVSTMGLAMQTAAETKTTFMVLDRPNPAGGDRVDGVVLDSAHTSFIGMYPLPNVHGLSVGEIARMIVDQRWLPGLDDLELEIVAFEGWPSRASWRQLDRAWVAPSPRLPTADIALLYTGMVLLAGTTLSDGSGTTTPFALVGAPFIESGEALAATLESRGLPGVGFEPITFTPQPIPGVSPTPLHQGVPVEGVRIVVTDRSRVEPFVVALEILVAAQSMRGSGQSLITDPASFDLVAGTSELRRWLERGDSAAAILERLQPDLETFESLRATALLYD